MIDAIAKFSIDRKGIIRKVEAKEIRCLHKVGAYTKTSMQRSMKYRKGPSPAGQPPHAHKDTRRGAQLRARIRYEVNPRSFSVIVGPPLIKSADGGIPVPKLLNQGGKKPRRLLTQVHFEPGQFGPIRRWAGGKKLARIRIKTGKQAARANRLAVEENGFREAMNQNSVLGRIAPRPFTAPAFTDGGDKLRQLIKKESL